MSTVIKIIMNNINCKINQYNMKRPCSVANRCNHLYDMHKCVHVKIIDQ